jgi:hypothetical protein
VQEQAGQCNLAQLQAGEPEHVDGVQAQAEAVTGRQLRAADLIAAILVV